MNLGDYLERFDEGEVDRRYRHARHFLTGSLFVCHAGADFRRILNCIAFPVLSDRYGDGYFLHNRGSGGSEAYKVLARAALHWCDKFLFVASKNTEGHEWVHAELDWLFRRSRSIIVCLLEDVRTQRIHRNLEEVFRKSEDEIIVDFRTDVTAAQSQLGRILDRQLAVHPYPRRVTRPLPNEPGKDGICPKGA